MWEVFIFGLMPLRCTFDHDWSVEDSAAPRTARHFFPAPGSEWKLKETRKDIFIANELRSTLFYRHCFEAHQLSSAILDSTNSQT